MDPVPGYEIAGWERGYGDFALSPDLALAAPDARGSRGRRSSSATCSGTTAPRSSRHRARCCAPRSREPRRSGFSPMLGSELEFFLFRESYAEAHELHYRDLTPSVPYILDYHVLATRTTSR